MLTFVATTVLFGELGSAAQPSTGGLELIDPTPLDADDVELRLRLPGLVEADDVINLTIHETISNRAGFLVTVDRASAGDVMFSFESDVGSLDPSVTGLVELSFAAAELGTAEAAVGVHPVAVEMTTATGAALGSLLTYLVVPPLIPTPSQVALALVMDVRPTENAAGTIDDDDPVAVWIDALVERPDIPVTLQPVPLLLEDYASDQRIRALQTRMAGELVVSGPFLPIDERALAVEGFGDHAGELMQRGVDSLTSFSGTAPDSTIQLSASRPDADLAGIWRDRGVRSLVSVGDPTFDSPVEAETVTGPVVLLATPDRFGDASPDNPTIAANRILAELAVIAISSDHPTASVLLYNTGTNTDPEFVESLLDGLLDIHSLVALSSVADALATNPLTTSTGQRLTINLKTGTDSPRLDGGVAEYRTAEQMLSAYRSMIRDEHTGFLYDEQADKLISLLGSGVTGAQREQAAGEIVDTIKIELQTIRPPPIGQVNLTSRTATYPFAFQNNSSYPVRIEARFISDKARFVDLEDGESLNLWLEPGVTPLETRVEALSSGSFPLRIELVSPDGGLLLGAVDLEVRSTAPSGIGVLISVAAGGVLVLWWGRELIRSRRRSREQVPTDAHGSTA
ncbi:MAG: hypothetical protein GY925_26660 [Actinomycetia bacterium]|nr:hypothetical protein [Actinomycetes bacterium]